MPDCQHCHQPLNVSQYNARRTVKSCPNCSTINGKHHVYYAYPDEFGTTALRATASTPDGAQSYCTACRGGQTPTATSIPCRMV